MLERVKTVKDLVVRTMRITVHDGAPEWSQSILGIHHNASQRLGALAGLAKRPKDQNGMLPWTVCDYPLLRAVEDRIVGGAADRYVEEDDPKQPATRSQSTSREDNVTQATGYCELALRRWKERLECL